MIIFTEFFDQNSHCCYPFDHINDIPTDFLVDARFMVTSNVVKDSVSINKIIVGANNIQLFITCEVQNHGKADLGLLKAIPINNSRNTEHAVKLINEEYEVILEGSITIGTCESIVNKSQGVYTLGTNGLLLPLCIMPVTEWCTGFVINDKLYTGVVHLEFGTGFQVISDNNTLRIQAIGLELPKDNIETISDKEMQQIAQQAFAGGVTSINGLTGAVTIAAGTYSVSREYDSVTDGVEKTLTDANNLQVTTNGQAIILSNSKDDPTYDVNGADTPDNTSIKTLLANATALNDRYQAMEQHNYAVDNAVNLLSNQVSKVN